MDFLNHCLGTIKFAIVNSGKKNEDTFGSRCAELGF
jgi:hypothetical protein